MLITCAEVRSYDPHGHMRSNRVRVNGGEECGGVREIYRMKWFLQLALLLLVASGESRRQTELSLEG